MEAEFLSSMDPHHAGPSLSAGWTRWKVGPAA
jgi:hypothetical protein